MRRFRTQAWQYGVLLVILLCIASIAVWSTLDFIRDQELSVEASQLLTIRIWMLTLGFMLISGAFGLWGMKISAETESRRHAGQLIDAMNLLTDGMMLVDRNGRIEAFNKSLERFTREPPLTGAPVQELLPSLSEADVELLTDPKSPSEIERSQIDGGVRRRVRFRAQPISRSFMIMVSDVTAMRRQRVRRRQAARLQLVGQLAQGIAEDFTRLLCSVSGNASALPRLDSRSPEAAHAIQSINHQVEKGVLLANNLQQLAGTSVTSTMTDAVAEHVQVACDALRDSLPQGWEVELETRSEIPAAGLPAGTIEQVVLNLGLLVAESAPTPTTMRVVVSRTVPGERAGSTFCGGIQVESTHAPQANGEVDESATRDTSHASGIMLSVIRSMIEEGGGALDCFKSVGGSSSFVIRLPYSEPGEIVRGIRSDNVSDELRAYLAEWYILFASPESLGAELDGLLRDLDVHLERATSIVATLGRLDTVAPLDAMLLDQAILGAEPAALLRAILKLRPDSAIVVLTEGDLSSQAEFVADAVFLSRRSPTGSILLGLIEARHLAVNRCQRLADKQRSSS